MGGTGGSQSVRVRVRVRVSRGGAPIGRIGIHSKKILF